MANQNTDHNQPSFQPIERNERNDRLVAKANEQKQPALEAMKASAERLKQRG